MCSDCSFVAMANSMHIDLENKYHLSKQVQAQARDLGMVFGFSNFQMLSFKADPWTNGSLLGRINITMQNTGNLTSIFSAQPTQCCLYSYTCAYQINSTNLTITPAINSQIVPALSFTSFEFTLGTHTHALMQMYASSLSCVCQ